MKKILAMFLAMTMCIYVAGCNSTSSKNNVINEPNEDTVENSSGEGAWDILDSFRVSCELSSNDGEKFLIGSVTNNGYDIAYGQFYIEVFEKKNEGTITSTVSIDKIPVDLPEYGLESGATFEIKVNYSGRIPESYELVPTIWYGDLKHSVDELKIDTPITNSYH